MIICYTVPEIWYKSDVIVIFHFGQFLTLLNPLSAPPLPPRPVLTAKKMKISKKWKKKKKTHMEVSTFSTIVPKIMIICFIAPEMWHVTDVNVTFHFWLFFALLHPKQPEK